MSKLKGRLASGTLDICVGIFSDANKENRYGVPACQPNHDPEADICGEASWPGTHESTDKQQMPCRHHNVSHVQKYLIHCHRRGKCQHQIRRGSPCGYIGEIRITEAINRIVWMTMRRRE